MAYHKNANQDARFYDHKPEYSHTAKFRAYSVDVFRCSDCGAETQIGSTLAIGTWASREAEGFCKPNRIAERRES